MFGGEYGCATHSNEQTGSSDRYVATALLCGNALLGAGLTHLLTGTRFGVIGGGRVGDTSSAGQADAGPALYIVDASGSPQQTMTFVEDAKRQHPSARIVVIANSFDLHLVQLAVAAGVDSFCLATVDREVLINVLELTVLGEQILPWSVIQPLLDVASTVSGLKQTSSSDQSAPDPKVGKLSPRETVILQSLMGGEANKVIARKLEITEATIKVHVKSILRKIGAANRTQAAMWANENLRVTEKLPLIN
jgi:two-component system, NarL family, nitrate/nitrite response regulator NarL